MFHAILTSLVPHFRTTTTSSTTSLFCCAAAITIHSLVIVIIGNLKKKKDQQIKFIIINIVVTTDKISLCQHSLGHWHWHWHWYVNEKSLVLIVSLVSCYSSSTALIAGKLKLNSIESNPIQSIIIFIRSLLPLLTQHNPSSPIVIRTSIESIGYN